MESLDEWDTRVDRIIKLTVVKALIEKDKWRFYNIPEMHFSKCINLLLPPIKSLTSSLAWTR